LKIEIKCRFSGKVLFEHEQEENSVKITLEAGVKAGAYLDGAYLDGANLAGAYLARANLDRAYLDGANLDGAYLAGANLAGATYSEGVEIGNKPLFILGLTWPVYIFKTHIKIGCQIHTKQEWLEFDDAVIAKMESRAPEFWAKWKKHILWIDFEGKE
jgi:hypothetical protein